MEKYKNPDLSARERAEDLTSRMTLKEQIKILVETSVANERLGIPKYYHGNEALHGVIRPGKMTVFPAAIAFGSTFDPDLIEEITDAISDEARAVHHHGRGVNVTEEQYDALYSGLLTFWSPDLNLCRDPRWGRTAETYGEDPYLAGKMGAAFVRGLQGKDPKYLKAVSTPKHFTANNEEHNRFSCNAVMSEKNLREYHLEPFRMAVQEGHCAAVMGAYNAINGVPCHANHRLLTDILRDEWGFKGYIVSDCGGVSSIYDSHHQFDSKGGAAAAAMNAGVDLECGNDAYPKHLEEECEKGNISAERIKEACINVLTARFLVGQFDEEAGLVPFAKIPLSVVGCEAHHKLAVKCAVESTVMLKNNGILPLDTRKKVAVIGNNAHIVQFGDYSGNPVCEPVNAADAIAAKAEICRSVKWKYRASGDSFIPVQAEYLSDADGNPGVSGEYFTNPGFVGKTKMRKDATIDFSWNDQMPDPLIETSQFGIRWNGVITAPADGVYTLRFACTGYVRCEAPVFILNGEKIEHQAVITMKAGEKIPFSAEYRCSDQNPSAKLEWIAPTEENFDPFTEEVEAAAEADVVIAVIGLGKGYECEGHDKESLNLPPEQCEMLRRVFAVNSNVITVLVNGSPITVSEIADNSAAVLETWYPGEAGGEPLAAILYGEEDPSGRLCATFPYSVEDLPPFDDYENSKGRTYMYSEKAYWPFGFGLSYTKFAYEDPAFASETDKDGNTVRTVTVTVHNTGNCKGTDTVQLYLDSAGEENQPHLRLVRFGKVCLNAGEKKTVSFALDEETFKVFDYDGSKKLLKGNVKAYIGGCLPTSRSLELGGSDWCTGEFRM